MPALKNFYFKGENIREEKPVERKKDIPFFLFFVSFFEGMSTLFRVGFYPAVKLVWLRILIRS